MWVSLPVALLGIAASIIGIFVKSIYAEETANWAAQGVGQDIANLVAFPVLLAAAWFARKGSIRAYACWLGALVYSAYTYVIYAFAIHFGPLFLIYVAVMGLSIYALMRGLLAVAVGRVRVQFSVQPPVRAISSMLIGVGVLFSGLWLAEIVPAVLRGDAPQSLADVGLVTNPVHILDLSILLPSSILTGVALLRRRPWSFVVAPTILVGMILIGIGIASAMVTLGVRGEAFSWGPASMIAVMTVLQAVAVTRFLRSMQRALTTEEVR
jgi:hypothetical protein